MARPLPLVLLPPSEGKTPDGDGPPWKAGALSHPALDRNRRQVLDALAAAVRGPGAGALLGVKGEALAAAITADRTVRRSPTMPAIERYSGVLYTELDHATLPAASRRRLDACVRIVSGAFGLVSPSDPIPDYKLKMGATLPPMGRLATWWRPAIEAEVRELAAGRTIWDLLPTEHAAACRTGALGAARVLTVRFVDDVGNGATRRLVTVSHWNKLLKGALVRHLLATGLDDPDGLTRFTHPLGYTYRRDLTTERSGRTEVSLVLRRDG